MKYLRFFLRSIAITIGWIVGFVIFFGPAQLILGNPEYQSEKLLTVFRTLEPLPRMEVNFWIFPVGIFVISLFYSGLFEYLKDKLPGNRWKKGLTFGVMAWVLMVPFFEFYLPWNVMHEPFALVLLEMVCWFGVMMMIGIGIAFTSKKKEPGKISETTEVPV